MSKDHERNGWARGAAILALALAGSASAEPEDNCAWARELDSETANVVSDHMPRMMAWARRVDRCYESQGDGPECRAGELNYLKTRAKYAIIADQDMRAWGRIDARCGTRIVEGFRELLALLSGLERE